MTAIRQTSPPLLLSLFVLLELCLRPNLCAAIPRPVAGTSWQLHSIVRPAGAADTIDLDGNAVAKLTPVLAHTQITAHFGDHGGQIAGSLTGSGGCNDYFADFLVDLSTMGITFDHVGSTEMDCGEEIMEQESAYFAALEKTSSHDILGDALKLRDEGGEMMLLFIPLLETEMVHEKLDDEVDLNVLAGTEWRASSYLSQDTSTLVPILSGSKLSLTFESGTSFKGNGGCNSYFGSYASSSSEYSDAAGGDDGVDGRLSIFELGSTEMGCVDPLGIMGQEMAYFDALRSAVGYRLRSTDNDDEDNLQALLLLDSDGVVVLTFLPAWALDLHVAQEYIGISDIKQSAGNHTGSKAETIMIEHVDVNGEGSLHGGNSKLDQTNAMASIGDTSSARDNLAIPWKRVVFYVAMMVAGCRYLLM